MRSPAMLFDTSCQTELICRLNFPDRSPPDMNEDSAGREISALFALAIHSWNLAGISCALCRIFAESRWVGFGIWRMLYLCSVVLEGFVVQFWRCLGLSTHQRKMPGKIVRSSLLRRLSWQSVNRTGRYPTIPTGV